MMSALVVGLAILLLVSCGDDGVTDPDCSNCDFWSKAFSRHGRFPAVSPVDAQLVAFSHKPEGADYDNIWVARLQAAPDTTTFHRITSDDYMDFNPSWSPDGQMIAFERSIGAGDERQIFVVDVLDLNNPGIPVAITENDGLSISYSNSSPSWVEIGGETWISFCNIPVGAGDSDIGIVKYPDPGYPALDTVWVSLDPSQFAAGENNVMSAVFEDQHASGNGTNLIAFSSPDRQQVGDIRVIATSEEQPDTTVVASILINDKDSGQFTPHTFRYRPAGADIQVVIAGNLEDYCSNPGDTLLPVPDTLNTFVLDFVHTHGTLAVRTTEPNVSYIVFIDGRDQDERTPQDTTQYVFFECVEAGTHVVETKDVYGSLCGSDSGIVIEAGMTTFVRFDCGGEAIVEYVTGPRPCASAPRTLKQAAPAALQIEERSVWLMDLGDTAVVDDDRVYFVYHADVGLYYPVLSPDGKYIAYIVGSGDTWNIGVSDISGLVSGDGVVNTVMIGLPGSDEDIECWREIEKISWFPTEPGRRRIVASISPCRGGSPGTNEVWIADLSQFLPD